MGSKEDVKTPKPENSSSPKPDISNFHVYPDWAAMQAYYAPRVAFPPYFNAVVTSGQAAAPHPYIWPQPVMSPYGPYAAVYSPGGVYAHPAVTIGAHSNGHGVSSLPPVADAVAPLSMELPGKSTGTSDQGLMKKLKRFDGLAMSIGNGNMDSSEGDHGLSQRSNDNVDGGETEGSTDVTDGNTTAVGEHEKKRRHEGTPTEEKKENKGGSLPVVAADTKVSAKDLSIDVASAGGTGNLGGKGGSGNFELNSPSASAQTSPDAVPVRCGMVSPESWLQNEQDLKRERRKQSNRESARRSRLRRLAEADELAKKVDTLVAENIALKSEMTRLAETTQNLRLKNAALMEKLKDSGVVKKEEMLLDKVNNNCDGGGSHMSRVSDMGSVGRDPEDEGMVYEHNPNAGGAKLRRQLLGSNPRADAVAAG